MVDSLRSGGFSFPDLGYGSRSGGFSQYRIGNDDSDNLAYLDKLSAQTAWQNGQISDGQYLQALQDYVDALDKDSSSYISAVNQLEDATWNIGRNKLVTDLNAAGSPRARQAAIQRLIGYDRRWRATMTPDNEQYREISSRINDLQEQSRSTRWSALVEQYNRNRVSDARMMAAAQQLAKEAGNRPDAATYRGYVQQFHDSILDDQLQTAIDDWDKTGKPSPQLAQRVAQLYQQRMASMNPDSPTYKRYADALASFQEQVTNRQDALEYQQAISAHEAGTMSDDAWLSFLHGRVAKAKPGTTERIQARDAFINASFGVAEDRLKQQVEAGTRTVGDLIDFYQSNLAVMDLDSSRAQQLLAEIAQLRSKGYEALDITGSATGTKNTPQAGGHWVMPSGVGVKDGYISQHDGSTFASTNCGMAAAAMLVWDVTGGDIKVSGGEMRYYSGDTEKGTWTDDMVRAMGVIGIGAREYHGMSLETFRRRVASGKPAVLTGTNGMLPTSMQYGYAGDHSVFVARIKVQGNQTLYWVMDPNASGDGYTGAWWTEQQLYAFGWQGHYQGSTVFAGKSGNLQSKMDPNDLPPVQRFDTDYLGRSTVGRGGGTSRTEAGPRQDWSKGKKVWKAQKKAGGPEAVSDFLGAVDAVERNLTPARRGEVEQQDLADGENARTMRASRILARNDNDPRRAMVEWFTGEKPNADPSTWSKSERFYGNAAARKLNLDKVDTTPAVGETGGTGEKPGKEKGGNTPASTTPELAPTGLDPDAERVAKGILQRLGVKPNAKNVTAMAAWIQAESGNTIDGNNPLNLHTPGQEDLAGQYGRNDEGMALFDSLEEGMDAAANEIKSRMPEMVGALKQGDPETIMGTLAGSQWSDDPESYARVVTQVYNKLPGDRPLITRNGASPYEIPTDFATVARSHPEVADLFDVDYTDEVQAGWFEDNWTRMAEAAKRGDSTFLFLPPGETEFSGGGYHVPVSPQVAKDVGYVRFQYGVETLPPGKDRAEKAQALFSDFTQFTDEVDIRSLKRYLESNDEDHTAALLRGDLATAYNLENARADAINAAIGLPPGSDPNIQLANRDFTEDDHSWLSNEIDKLQPRSVDPQRSEENAPQGSLLRALVRDGKATPTYSAITTRGQGSIFPVTSGQATAFDVEPGSMFTTVLPNGQAALVTADTSPDMFDEVKVQDGMTGEYITVPKYQSFDASGMVPVQTALGRSYQPVETQQDALVDYYFMDNSGRSRDIEAARQQPKPADPNGLGVSLGSLSDTEADWSPKAPLDPNSGYLRRLDVDPASPGGQPIYRLEMYDSETRDTTTWLSLDRVTWIGWAGRRYGSEQRPGLVAMNGATWRSQSEGEAPVLLIDGHQYDPNTDGPITNYLGWYGTPGVPGSANDGVGARGSDMMVKTARITQASDGGLGEAVIDLALTPYDRARAGIISYEEAAHRTMAVMGPRGATGAATVDQEMAAQRADTHVAIPTTTTDLIDRTLQLSRSMWNIAVSNVRAAAATSKADAASALAQAEADRAARAQAQAEAEAAAKKAVAKPAPSARPNIETTTPAPSPKPRSTPVPSPTPAPGPSPTPQVKSTTPKATTPKTVAPTPPKVPVTQTESWRQSQGTTPGGGR